MATALAGTIPSIQVAAQPSIIELVGPAGAGKSTVAGALCQQDDQITAGAEIAFRKVEQLPILVRSLPLVVSCLFQAGSRRWRWEEIKYLIYLQNWRHVLESQTERTPGIIVLDHGPVFKLATLHAFGPSGLRSTSAAPWWAQLFAEWASAIDLIIWLDAPDALLERRIQRRAQKHSLKGKPTQEAQAFLACYRSSYHYVLSGLALYDGPDVLSFDTSQVSSKKLVAAILEACNLRPGTDR